MAILYIFQQSALKNPLSDLTYVYNMVNTFLFVPINNEYSTILLVQKSVAVLFAIFKVNSFKLSHHNTIK